MTDLVPTFSPNERRILADWERFIQSGFRQADFSETLYRHLITHCAFTNTDRAGFWQRYFDGSAELFVQFLNQFGGDYTSVEVGHDRWLHGEAAPLNRALCAVLTPLAETLFQALTAQARQTYEAERRAEVTGQWRRLHDESLATAETYTHLDLIYEVTFPFEAYADQYRLSAGLRAGLAGLLNPPVDVLGQPGLFGVRRRPAEGAAEVRAAAPPVETATTTATAAAAAETEPLTVAPASDRTGRQARLAATPPESAAEAAERQARMHRLAATPEELAVIAQTRRRVIEVKPAEANHAG